MRSEEQQLREQLAQGCGCRTKEQLKAENEALRVIVAEIHWMARRYADGRSTYAPGMLNSRTKDLLGMGIELRTPHFARDGMGRQYDGLTEDEVKAAEDDMPKAFPQPAGPKPGRTPEEPDLTPEGYVLKWVREGKKSSARLPGWEREYQERGLIEAAERAGYIRIGRDVACTIYLLPKGAALAAFAGLDVESAAEQEVSNAR